MTPALVASLALLIGVVLGMLGGGGAILTVPLLVYVAHVDAKAAIAMSLFVVGATSVVGAALHARGGRVQYRVGALFGGAAMAGAYGGGSLAQFVPANVLLVAFAAVMLLTATAMLRGRKETAGGGRPLAVGRVLLLGAGVGVVSGLVGAGGGFLIVPALTLFGGLAMKDAVGTSLFIIALQSFAGFAGHVTHTELDWSLAGTVTGATVLGALAGTFAGTRVSPQVLRRGFAWLVLAMGQFMVSRQLPLAATVGVAVLTLAAVLSVLRKSSSLVAKLPEATAQKP
jgi:uncharacterized membrane protein YfcA